MPPKKKNKGATLESVRHSGPNLGLTSREKWLLPPAQIGRSGGPEGEVTMTVHAKWWMMQYYEGKKIKNWFIALLKP